MMASPCVLAALDVEVRRVTRRDPCVNGKSPRRIPREVLHVRAEIGQGAIHDEAETTRLAFRAVIEIFLEMMPGVGCSLAAAGETVPFF